MQKPPAGREGKSRTGSSSGASGVKLVAIWIGKAGDENNGMPLVSRAGTGEKKNKQKPCSLHRDESMNRLNWD